MKRFISLVLLCLLLTVPVWASEDITSRVEQRLLNETAYITLYCPNASASVYGDLVYDEVSGSMQLQPNGEEPVAVREISVENVADYADSYSSEEEDGENAESQEALIVPEGYVFLRVERSDGVALLLCMAEDYALSDEELAARAEAELEAQEDDWDVLIPREESESTEETAADEFEEDSFDFTDEESFSVTELSESTEIPVVQSKSTGLLSFLDDFSQREFILLIASLVLLLALILSLALLLPYKKRADSIGLSYIGLKTAHTKLKRENARLKAERLRLEQELVAERGKSVDAALRETNRRFS